MSQTMSGSGDWFQFYNHNLPSQATSPGHAASRPPPDLLDTRVSDDTVVTSTVTSVASLMTPLGSGGAGTSSSNMSTGHRLSPEGRVSKPIRRRSRASRRTPTTLLNTDTTNFRAMVQQFTGGPSAPFASAGAHPGAPNFGFGLGAAGRQAHVNNPSAMMFPPGRGYHPLQPQPQLYQPQSQQYMFSLGSNNGPGDAFLQRLSSSRPSNAGLSDGFVMEGVSSSFQVPRPSSSSNENRSNSLMF